jgi:hypothetical protein
VIPPSPCGCQVRYAVGAAAGTVAKLRHYRAFEQAVTTAYDAETAVERELVLRLASLLWRLRRATSVETGLLQIQYEATTAPDPALPKLAGEVCEVIEIFQSGRDPSGRELARCFLRLADLDNGIFERLGRYEAALWRQVRQTIFTLQHLQWRGPGAAIGERRIAGKGRLWGRRPRIGRTGPSLHCSTGKSAGLPSATCSWQSPNLSLEAFRR